MGFVFQKMGKIEAKNPDTNVSILCFTFVSTYVDHVSTSMVGVNMDNRLRQFYYLWCERTPVLLAWLYGRLRVRLRHRHSIYILT